MRRRWRRRPGALTAAALIGAVLLLAGCAQSVDPIERLGEKAAQRVRRATPARELTYHEWRPRAPHTPPPPEATTTAPGHRATRHRATRHRATRPHATGSRAPQRHPQRGHLR